MVKQLTEVINIRAINTNVSEKKFKGLIEESVREVLTSELMKLRVLSRSDVSEREQKDIEKGMASLLVKSPRVCSLKHVLEMVSF